MKYVVRFLKVVISIVVIGGIVSLFQGQISGSLVLLMQNLKELVLKIIHPSDFTFNPGGKAEYSVFPAILEYYRFSFMILALGFFLSFMVALTFTYITFYLPFKMRTAVSRMVGIFEAIPDIFIIVVTQLLFVAIFKKTGILVFDVAGAYERPFILPLVTYTILPSIMLYRIMLLIFTDEMQKPYVELAKGKGLEKGSILLVHVFRNSLVSVSNHSKVIISFMLSNLVMLEILFNLYGITWFIIENPRFEIAVLGILMLFLPIFLIETLTGVLVKRFTGEEIVE
ncbi:ABC transporter permease subunit [Pseudalkalibacillus caeni]|uniref:ABC transporter permease subunit n=1 Tax=Exobacillus caeni TaxID=2574798 RepID=A0A5R9F5W4_9BACL|nr:ABC transporter permease subunit [Pseudalkalibacillus caeni]TLS37028.1 ABC transporter permease subunit [Pseudalkalibacillus caeni]